MGALGQPYPEELVEGAAVLIVVSREAVRGADEPDLVPAPLPLLAGVALAAAPVLGPGNGPLVLLHEAAELCSRRTRPLL